MKINIRKCQGVCCAFWGLVCQRTYVIINQLRDNLPTISRWSMAVFLNTTTTNESWGWRGEGEVDLAGLISMQQQYYVLSLNWKFPTYKRGSYWGESVSVWGLCWVVLSGLMSSKFDTCFIMQWRVISFFFLVVAENKELLMMVHRCLTAVMIKIRLQMVQMSSY